MKQLRKKSFPPLVNDDTKILILGTLPGEIALQIKEYYGNPNNRFWKIIASITNSPEPLNYEQKKSLLHTNKIGLWDTLHSANRDGALDTAIRNEKPNNIAKLLRQYPNIKTIGFNSRKAEEIFNNHNKRNPNIRYVSLPSSSPANARFKLSDLQKIWKQIL